MKKTLFLLLVCLLSAISIKAQSEKVYVYGIDFSQAKVYAADESVEQFSEALLMKCSSGAFAGKRGEDEFILFYLEVVNLLPTFAENI